MRLANSPKGRRRSDQDGLTIGRQRPVVLGTLHQPDRHPFEHFAAERFALGFSDGFLGFASEPASFGGTFCLHFGEPLGADLRREPIEVRKATLASILRKSRPGVRLNEHLEHPDGITVFQHACKMGLEGIVSKRLGSRYRSGRSPDWLKFGFPRRRQ